MLTACGLRAQEVPFIKTAQLDQWKNGAGDTVYVLNFWATWCVPCVEELPSFEKITAGFAGQKVQVVLISTDFKRHVDTRVKSFLLEKQLKSKVVFLNEPNPNDYINLINPEWTGAIPATLIVCRNRNFERFFEKQMSYDELETTIRAALSDK